MQNVNRKQRFKGFTLLEAIVVVALVGILAGLAIPSVSGLLASDRSQSFLNELKAATTFAKNTAISTGDSVVICPLSGNSCTSNWTQNITVFIDFKEDPGNVANQFDGRDRTIRLINKVNKNDRLTFQHNRLVFGSDGYLDSTNGTFNYCPAGVKSENKRANKKMTISGSGRALIQDSEDC